jgi:hypothetical protein
MEKGLAKTIGDRYRDLSLNYANHNVSAKKHPKKRKKLDNAPKTPKTKKKNLITVEDRLRYLIKCSKIGAKNKTGVAKLSKKRLYYEAHRHKLLPLHEDTLCFCCYKPATIRHHKILLTNGGTNEPYNLVPLCETCHMNIHPWMDFINPIDNELDNKSALHTELKQMPEMQGGQVYMPVVTAGNVRENGVLSQLRQAVNLA